MLFITDHNEDETPRLISEWVSNTKHFYHKVNVRYQAYPQAYKDATKGPNEYTLSRYEKLLQNRQVGVSGVFPLKIIVKVQLS